MDPDDQAIVTLTIASYGWVPPQVKAIFVERHGTDLTVHLGCDRRDERVRDAEEDIGTDAHSEARDPWRVVGLRTHETPDIGDWRARGWLPVHLAAEWGEHWTEPGDELATIERPQEWTPEPAELARPEFHTRSENLPSYTEFNLLAALAHAAAGQITPTVEAVNMVVSDTTAKIYWHLDTPPDDATARAMNITALRLDDRCAGSDSLRFLAVEHRWYAHDPEPPRTYRWELFFGRDDPRTWAERDRDDASEPAE